MSKFLSYLEGFLLSPLVSTICAALLVKHLTDSRVVYWLIVIPFVYFLVKIDEIHRALCEREDKL